MQACIIGCLISSLDLSIIEEWKDGIDAFFASFVEEEKSKLFMGETKLEPLLSFVGTMSWSMVGFYYWSKLDDGNIGIECPWFMHCDVNLLLSCWNCFTFNGLRVETSLRVKIVGATRYYYSIKVVSSTVTSWLIITLRFSRL
jgi:hypothetical protein